MVSIGSYHKGNPKFHSMEKYKLLYLQRFLKRKKELYLESCISELQELKEKALKSYNDIGNIKNNSHEFCEMLLLDGCFVVEFIRQNFPEGEEEIIESNIACIYNQILRDLMLLENQLSFFILNNLHDLTKQDDELPLAIQAVFSFTFFVDLEKMTKQHNYAPLKKIESNAGNIKHLLHAVHILSCHGNPKKSKSNDPTKKLTAVHKFSCLGNPTKKSTAVHKFSCFGNPTETSKDDTTCHMHMPNATELSEAGVRFTKVKSSSSNNNNNSDMTSLFDITFVDGLMKTPCFQVIDETEAFLQNLIAYEQQSCEVQPKYFSDFAVFMNYLIDSDKDVNLLRQKGIIKHWIGEDKDVSSLFNKIGNGVTMYSTFHYKKECLKATQYCEKTLNRVIANLMRNYFSSPWVGASTIAAIILLMLTTIQTILAITGSIKK